MGGRPPKTPTAILEARGSKRAKERRDAELILPSGCPPCPPSIKGEGARLWADICATFAPVGGLAATDWPSLTALCRTYQAWWEAEEYVSEHGAYYDINQGGQKIRAERPEARRARQLLAELRPHFIQYGLSPASRANVTVPAGRPKPSVKKDAEDGGDVRRAVFGE